MIQTDQGFLREPGMSFLSEFVGFVLARKRFWLVPVFLVTILVGSLLVFAKGSVIAPLIYAIF